MIRIILIDDHTLIRTGLRQMLSAVKGIKVIGEVGTGQEGIELVRRLAPDVVLLDFRLPDMDGIAVAKKLLKQNSEVRILVVSSVMQDITVLRVLEAGAAGYVTKHTSVEELLQAIQAVYDSKRFISPKLASRLALTKVTTDSAVAFEKITDRERKVIERVIRGVDVKDIAAELHINHKTVHSYRERIFKKLGVDSDAAVTLLALHHGLLVLETETSDSN